MRSPDANAAGRRLLCLALALAATALLGFGAYRAAEAMEGSARPLQDEAELTLFPTGPWVRAAALGRTRLAADLAWLQAIQYYGKHRKTDRSYPHARTLFRTLCRLDPQFVHAYVFGAIVLAEDLDDMEGARALLREGMEANPEHWMLPFEYGFLSYLERKDMALAAEYMTRASRLPDAPAGVGRLAAYAAGKAGETEFAMELWRELLRSSENAEIRRIARRYLRQLGAPEAAHWPEEETG